MSQTSLFSIPAKEVLDQDTLVVPAAILEAVERALSAAKAENDRLVTLHKALMFDADARNDELSKRCVAAETALREERELFRKATGYSVEEYWEMIKVVLEGAVAIRAPKGEE